MDFTSSSELDLVMKAPTRTLQEEERVAREVGEAEVRSGLPLKVPHPCRANNEPIVAVEDDSLDGGYFDGLREGDACPSNKVQSHFTPARSDLEIIEHGGDHSAGLAANIPPAPPVDQSRNGSSLVNTAPAKASIQTLPRPPTLPLPLRTGGPLGSGSLTQGHSCYYDEWNHGVHGGDYQAMLPDMYPPLWVHSPESLELVRRIRPCHGELCSHDNRFPRSLQQNMNAKPNEVKYPPINNHEGVGAYREVDWQTGRVWHTAFPRVQQHKHDRLQTQKLVVHPAAVRRRQPSKRGPVRRINSSGFVDRPRAGLNSSKGSMNNADSARKGLLRSVSFGTLEIRTYETILDDNPACSSGPGLAIGWRYKANSVNLPVDQYEHRQAALYGNWKPRPEELLLDRSERESILRRIGYSDQELAQSARSVRRAKNARNQTVDNLQSAWLEERVESLRRVFGRMILRKERTRHLYDQWKGASSKVASSKRRT